MLFNVLSIFSLSSIYCMNVNDQLIEGILHKDLNAVRQALDSGADIHQREVFKWSTPLHIATYQGNDQRIATIIQLLLDRGATIDAYDNRKSTPAHSAVNHNSPIALKVLVRRGADVNDNQPKSFYQSRPLSRPLLPIAAAEKKLVPMIRTLINLGADTTFKDHFDKRTPLGKAQHFNNNKAVELLQTYDELMYQHPSKAVTYRAVEFGFIRPIIKAFKAGVSVSQSDLQDYLALAKHKAAQTNDEAYKDLGRMLIELLGVTTHQSSISKNGITPALYNVYGLPPELIELMRNKLITP